MSDTRAAIDAGNQNFMANFGRQDAAAMAGLYTASGCVMPANSEVLSGAANVQAFWQGAFDMGLKEAVLETADLEEHGDTAIETGRYTLRADGGSVADHGKYIVIWKNEGGTWKLDKDIWNTSQPAT
jgi:ketosteroid isomerase-like protein